MPCPHCSQAKKNAFALLSKQQFELAAAFFLLADDLDSAVKVCARQMFDVQLALVLCRLRGATASELLKATVRDELLPHAVDGADQWLRCVAHLLLAEPQEALNALSVPTGGLVGLPVSMFGLLPGTFQPCATSFFTQLTSSPRWLLSNAQPSQPLLLQSVHAFEQAGCPMLAFDLLCTCPCDAEEVAAWQLTPSRLRRCLVSRYAFRRAKEILDRTARGSVAPSALAAAVCQVQALLTAELELACDYAAVSLPTLRGHYSHCNTPPGCGLLALLALLESLGLRDRTRALVADAVDAAVFTLQAKLPHHHNAESCRRLLRLIATASAAANALVGMGIRSPEIASTDTLCSRIGLVFHLGCFAVGCSLRAFTVVSRVVCSTPEGQLPAELVLPELRTRADGRKHAGDSALTAETLEEPGRSAALEEAERLGGLEATCECVWARFLLGCLYQTRRILAGTSLATQWPVSWPIVAVESTSLPSFPPPLQQLESTRQGRDEELLFRWVLLLRTYSRTLASQTRSACSPLPVMAISAYPANTRDGEALRLLWVRLSDCRYSTP